MVRTRHGEGPDKGREKVSPATYDLYCRKGGRWHLQECFFQEERDEALAAAKRLDEDPQFEGVRLMHTKFATARRGAVEVLVWVSPRLTREMFKPRPPVAKDKKAPRRKEKPKKHPPPAARTRNDQERVDTATVSDASGARQGKTDRPKDERRVAGRRSPPVPGAPKVRRRAATAPSPPEPKRSGSEASTVSGKPYHDVTRFFQGAIDVVKGRVRNIDNLTALGLDLFLLGACDRCAAVGKLSKEEKGALIREVARTASVRSNLADVVPAKIEGLLAEEKNHVMIESGRQAMARFEVEAGNVFEGLADTLALWANPKPTAQVHGIVTIMFTDLVGSTRMTREKGDYGAQQVVRAHNAIVRNALASHDGWEVKHTGDGIMAGFPRATGAVKAAGMIVKAVARHNANAGETSFHLRIGLNAGEPIREENDYFGTTVQVAARACDKAGAEEILVTQAVRDLTAGSGIEFREAGRFALKGIDEEVVLWQVNWDDGG